MASKILLSALAGFALHGSAAFSQSTDTPKLLSGESVIRVQAEGSVKRTPDSASVGITIQSEGSTPAAAVQQNSVKLAKLMDDLRLVGISEASISADELAARPVFPEDNGTRDRSRIIGYRASQTVGIAVADITKLQAVVGRLVQDGYGDLRADFELKDRKSVEAEAQRAAVANAKAEAENLASALGKRVNRVLLVGNSPEAYRGWTNSDQNIIVTGSRMQPLVLKPAPIEVQSKVFVDWSMVDK